MKKITVAAVAAMVLAGSAMANENTTSSDSLDTMIAAATKNIALQDPTVTTTFGIGIAHMNGSSGPSFILNRQVDDSLAHVDLNFEASKDYTGGEIKFQVLPIFQPSYFGVGYLSAAADKIIKTPGADEFTPPTTITKHVSEKGVFGEIGFQDTFANFDGIKIGANLGYRFGGVQGPTAALEVSGKFAPEIFSQPIGLKVGFEQIKNNDENINRLGVYATYSF